MTVRKLYYEDPYIQEFSTSIVENNIDDNGRAYVVLKETAFYPTGGGQPNDTGYINGIKVTGAEELGDEIRHYVEGAIDETEVKGTIDWGRRFDHMQQHSGQHILSAAFRHSLGIDTAAFHLGREISTIDLTVEQLTDEMASKAEMLANEIVFSNKPIEIQWVRKEDLHQYPLHKEPSVEENIRLVIIPEVDYNGCGGTHPRQTGEIGTIKILSWEKHKKMVRLHFVCGGRVIVQLHQKQNIIQSLTKTMNSPEIQLPEAAEKLLQAQKELSKSLEETKDQLLEYEASALAVDSDGLIAASFEDRTLQEIQKLGKAIVSKNDQAVCLLTAKNGEMLQFFAARGKDSGVNLKVYAKDVLALINGKGGGSETAVQGGSLSSMSSEKLLSSMKLLFSKAAEQ
ncbi:alanyl-tRNA editing protein [Metabacillus sp. RGM 3146]|uniref:alanyl-tRNA editing protein n=1 Tax=Metabacillus sp. RGM 3146 TaxID=3401092 RepID=UPI003B9DACDF